MNIVAIGVTGGVLAVALLGSGWVVARDRRIGRIDTPEDAADAVEATLADARVAGAVVGADGAGALAVTEDGRVAAVMRRGKRLIAREVTWRNVRSTAAGIFVETGDPRLGEVVLAGVNALDIRRLAPKIIAR